MKLSLWLVLVSGTGMVASSWKFKQQQIKEQTWFILTIKRAYGTTVPAVLSVLLDKQQERDTE